MNKKQKLAIIILSIFIIGMCIGAADAAHTVKKGKYKAKLNNKEYKKLTKTQTKYKTVTKTRNVTKYHINVNVTSDGGSKTWTTLYDLDEKDLKYYESGRYKQDYTGFEEGELEYNVEKVPYTVTEKYQVKEPYKVRVKAKVQKTVGYKKVKLDRVVGHKYKTVYKYKTVKLKQVVYNAKTDTYTNYRGTHLKYKYKDWKLVKTITKYKSDGSYIEYDVIKSKKKVAVKQKIPIIKTVKTKKPILMNIRTTNSANRLLKGKKVYVEIYCNGNLLKKGTANIK